MKPGLPTTFATGRLESGKQAIIFGLPGNPVSAFASAHLFALPLARHRMGLEWKESTGTVIKVAVGTYFLQLINSFIHFKLNRDYKLDIRPEYVRACIQFRDSELPIGRIVEMNQMSSRLISVSSVNLLLKFPPKSEERTEIKKGEIVEAIVIDRI